MSTITIQCFNWHFGIEFDIISYEEENDNYAGLDDNEKAGIATKVNTE